MAPAHAELKVGVVNFNRLMHESPQAKAVQRGAAAASSGRKQSELQVQQAALKAKEERLQKDGATMSADQRAKAEKELRDGKRDFQQKATDFQEEATARQNEELSKLQNDPGGGGAELRARRRNSTWCWWRARHLLQQRARHHQRRARRACRHVDAAAAPKAPAARQVAGQARASAGEEGPVTSLTLGELAVRFGCELRGDPDCGRRRASRPWARPGPADCRSSPARNTGPQLRATRATAVVLAAADAELCPVAALIARNPYAAYARIGRAAAPAAGRGARHPRRSQRRPAARGRPERRGRRRRGHRAARAHRRARAGAGRVAASARTPTSAPTAGCVARVSIGAGGAPGAARHACIPAP